MISLIRFEKYAFENLNRLISKLKALKASTCWKFQKGLRLKLNFVSENQTLILNQFLIAFKTEDRFGIQFFDHQKSQLWKSKIEPSKHDLVDSRIFDQKIRRLNPPGTG